MKGCITKKKTYTFCKLIYPNVSDFISGSLPDKGSCPSPSFSTNSRTALANIQKEGDLCQKLDTVVSLSNQLLPHLH